MKMRLASGIIAALMLCGCGHVRDTGSKVSSSSSGEDISSAAEVSSAVKADESSQPREVYVRPVMPVNLFQQQDILDRAGDRFYLLTNCRYPVYSNTDVRYFPTGERFYEALLEELAKAEETIFLEYFIVKDGEMLDGILDILTEKIADDVDVRLLCDGFQQNDAFCEEMKGYGIDCRLYREPDHVSINERDHRKLAVIDGKAAFMGGANLADEYINVDSPYGRWKDAAILMRGDAVRSCTELFFEQWERGAELEKSGVYIGRAEPVEAEGFVMPYGESPYDGEDAARKIYLEIIDSAEDYLYITAPYLNIDDEVENAICSAAERGADVIVIVPGVPDKLYMELIARTHYERLVESGVRLYRFTPGFIHSKLFVSDDCVATVGSVNLNSRSFYCDFECGAVLTNVPCIADIKADILDTLAECELITEDKIIPLTPGEEVRAAMMANLNGMM
ncbi:phospholipase D-like domain-containing protein [Ruminococcus albus]|uniref:Cardiolipin synthase n=1 Tax=Ruminococcus albus TaxID=1264 RepID=A0A1H7KU99_RUMAL|nr:phospholipase D-like domain-containing protein [Ruminococcus albus]SEK89645.1 cardiolipin synthase [Ruminococcus albus]